VRSLSRRLRQSAGQLCPRDKSRCCSSVRPAQCSWSFAYLSPSGEKLWVWFEARPLASRLSRASHTPLSPNQSFPGAAMLRLWVRDAARHDGGDVADLAHIGLRHAIVRTTQGTRCRGAVAGAQQQLLLAPVRVLHRLVEKACGCALNLRLPIIRTFTICGRGRALAAAFKGRRSGSGTGRLTGSYRRWRSGFGHLNPRNFSGHGQRAAVRLFRRRAARWPWRWNRFGSVFARNAASVGERHDLFRCRNNVGGGRQPRSARVRSHRSGRLSIRRRPPFRPHRKRQTQGQCQRDRGEPQLAQGRRRTPVRSKPGRLSAPRLDAKGSLCIVGSPLLRIAEHRKCGCDLSHTRLGLPIVIHVRMVKAHERAIRRADYCIFRSRRHSQAFIMVRYHGTTATLLTSDPVIPQLAHEYNHRCSIGAGACLDPQSGASTGPSRTAGPGFVCHSSRMD
jgi:hypothetical protein